jgi:hypothetical protein
VSGTSIPHFAPGGLPQDSDDNALLRLAAVHLDLAWRAFCEAELRGDSPQNRRVWLDALKRSLAHHERLEGDRR